MSGCSWCNGRGWYWSAGPGERWQAKCDVCPPSTTPAEDRDWVPPCVSSMSDNPACLSSGAKSCGQSPDLSGLKAALERLRGTYSSAWEGRAQFTNPTDTPIAALFLAAERAGLLTDERPADPVEVLAVAMHALERLINGVQALNDCAKDKSMDRPPEAIAREFEASHQNAQEALAALRQGRGE